MSDDLSLIHEAALAAGEIAMAHFGGPLGVEEKADGAGPVTQADLAIDAMLRQHLLDNRPGYGWLSEETEDDPARLSKDRVFVVDPIDGTRSFVAGEKSFAVSIALVEAGVPVAGVVHLPARDCTYAAAKGCGATKNGEAITTTEASDPVTILAAKVNFEPQNWPYGEPRHKRKFRPSLAYRMCLVAEGRFDAMLTFRPAWEWDVAAGSLIVAEAGGDVTDAQGNAAGFNNQTPKIPGLVAAEKSAHAYLMSCRCPQK